MTFLKRWNDYTCVKPLVASQMELYHYTPSLEAVVGICNGTFWATDMADFKTTDKNEGHLILREVFKWISDNKSGDRVLMENAEKNIGTSEALDSFISNHASFVISMCLNGNSSYMWREYAKDTGYEIIFDSEALLSGIGFYVKDAWHDQEYVKHGCIVYDSAEQSAVFQKEYQDLMGSSSAGFAPETKIEMILEKLMYVGNYFKTDDHQNEEEYRFVVSTAPYKTFTDLLPDRKTNPANKHYIEIHFPTDAIKKVICADEEAEKRLSGKISNDLLELRQH